MQGHILPNPSELITFNLLPFPETSMREPDELLRMYERMLAHDIPGFVIRQSTLPEVANLLLPTGLVVPSNANGVPGDWGEHESTSLITEDTEDLGYHTHGLPEPDAPTTIVHHLTTKARHLHTVGTFTPQLAELARGLSVDDHFDMTTAASRLAESTMREDMIDPRFISRAVYRTVVEEGDIAVNRLTGASPNIHDFYTIAGPDEGSDRRSATIQ